MRSGFRLIVLIVLFLVFTIFPGLYAETKPDPVKQTKPAAKSRVESPATKPATTVPAAQTAVPDTAQLGFLTVTQPKSGDYFVQGNDVTIGWSKEGYIPPNTCYRISLRKDDKEVLQIVSSVCVNGYKWKVPMDIWGAGFKMKVETVDKKVSAESAAFPIINAKADLTIGQLTVTPQTFEAGQEATIQVRIDNGGNAKSEPMKAFIIMGYWNATLANAKKIEYPVPPLNFGDHINITHKEKFPAGDFYVVARVGKFWTPGSGDKMLPDDKVVHVSVRGENLPDLVACIFHPSKAPVGTPFNVMTIVQNIGKKQSPPSKMSIWVEGQGSIAISIPSLQEGEYRSFGRTVTFQNEGETYFRAEVDTENSVTETNENNNRITGKIIHRATQDPALKIEEVCSDGRRKAMP